MALSQSNLTVGIGIDTSKFIADSAIVKNELRNIKREVDAAAKAGDVGRLQVASQQQAQLTRQYAELARAARGAADAHKEAVPVFTQMGGAFSLLHSKTLLVTGAITAAGAAIFKLANDAAKATDELEDNAAALGISAGKLQALQLVAARAGGSTDDLVQGLSRFVRTLGQAQSAEDKLRDSVAKSAPAFETSAEWSKRLADASEGVSNIFKDLGINISQFPRNAEGTIQAYQAIAREISNLADSPIKAAQAAEIFGKGWRKQIEILADLNTTLPEAERALQEAGLISGSVAKKQSEAWLSSFNTLSTTVTGISTAVGNTIGTALVPVFVQLNAFLIANKDTFVTWGQNIGYAITIAAQQIELFFTDLRSLGQGLTTLWNGANAAAQGFIAAWDAAFGWFGDKVNTVLEWLDWIIAKGKEAWAWLQPAGGTPTATEVGGGGAVGGAAAGGYIRGRGTGTSDSILARLSNGEYVINAASVRRLGVGFLSALNGFAAGGLVGMPPIRFAEGGLVSAASSGRPVHLHLGGQSFALSGRSGVVDALVSHAHSQQIRSAGVKPSWFAGRPSGR